MSGSKSERLQLRVDEPAKRRLEEAAAAMHLSTSAFVLQAASIRAEQVLADRSSIALGATAARAFAEALTAPARISERLVEALGRPAKVQWLD
jgi:uncharacterized protein (DUF1778 family)